MISTYYNCDLICFGPCIVVINEEEGPARCYLVFYYTYGRLNMFRAALCPSSGAHNYISDYHMDRLIIRLLVEGVLVQVGWLRFRAEARQVDWLSVRASAPTLSQPVCAISNLRIRRFMW
jgi:hypothetical protein